MVNNHLIKNGSLATLVNVDSALFRYLRCCFNRNNELRQRHSYLEWPSKTFLVYNSPCLIPLPRYFTYVKIVLGSRGLRRKVSICLGYVTEVFSSKDLNYCMNSNEYS